MAASRTPLPVTDITQYGAKAGDPVFDNSTAIQKAIDAVRYHGGGIVYVPVGEFYCRRPLTLDYASGISIVGAAKARVSGPSILHFTFLENKNDPLYVPPEWRLRRTAFIQARFVQGLKLQDLAVKVDKAFNGALIDLDGGTCPGDGETRDVVIEDCFFSQITALSGNLGIGYSADLFRLGRGSSRIAFSRCEFHGGLNSIASDGARDVLIEQCLFSQGGSLTPIKLRAPSDSWTIRFCGFQPSSYAHASNNWMRGVWCTDDAGEPIKTPCRGMVIIHNSIPDDGDVSCDVFRLVVRGLYFVGNFFSRYQYRSALVLHAGSYGAFVGGNYNFAGTGGTSVMVRVDEGVQGVVLVSNSNRAGNTVATVCLGARPQGENAPVALLNSDIVVGGGNYKLPFP